jgi:hypothetical protein
MSGYYKHIIIKLHATRDLLIRSNTHDRPVAGTEEPQAAVIYLAGLYTYGKHAAWLLFFILRSRFIGGCCAWLQAGL